MNEKIKKEIGIYYFPVSKTYLVLFSIRDPETRESRSRRKTRDFEGNPITTLNQARRVRARLKEELLFFKGHLKNPPWVEVVTGMAKEMAENTNLKSTTILNYQGSLMKHTGEAWGALRIREITRSKIKTLFESSNWKPHQKKNMIKYLKKAFDYALDNEFISKSPMPNLSVRLGPRVKSYLNEREVKELLYEADKRNNPWFPIWLTAIHTGMRASELRGLTWEAVDLDGKVINVYKTQDRSSSTYEPPVFGMTKSRVDRTVPISQPLYEALVKLRANGASEYVLPRLDDWVKGNQSRLLREFLGSIGLRSIRFHDLRATFCTLMLTKGIPPIFVMKIGGWKNMDTMDEYLRLSGVEVAGKTDCLDDIKSFASDENVITLNSNQNH